MLNDVKIVVRFKLYLRLSFYEFELERFRLAAILLFAQSEKTESDIKPIVSYKKQEKINLKHSYFCFRVLLRLLINYQKTSQCPIVPIHHLP